MSGGGITVGIDIGTSSVKALAADDDGAIVASARIEHGFSVPTPDRFEHDAAAAWFRGPRAALDALGDVRPAAVSVAAMVPSLCAVGDDGVPIGPGLLYGDERGRTGSRRNPAESGELSAFLRWAAADTPHARGFWPAQAVANFALSGDAVISTTAAATALPLFDWVSWDAGRVEALGARVEQMPRVAVSGAPAGTVRGSDAVLEPGTIDALGEQVVAGADEPGDVLVICGTTLIVWSVLDADTEVADHYSVPHTTAGRFLVGGPSNAGGLFLDWVRRLLGDVGGEVDPGSVPLWVPYVRGERVPLHDPMRRASIESLDLTHGAAAARRAAYEASGFVTRRMIEAVPATARRLVATGGGVRDAAWLQALADCTGLPVDVTAVAEGGALGAAFLARLAAGFESSLSDARRWTRLARRVEPDPRWRTAVDDRYARWLERAR
jgi:xylulokinase